MPTCTRRALLGGGAAFAAFIACPGLSAGSSPKTIIRGPRSGPSVTIIHAIRQGFLKDAEFRSWASIDELSAGIASGAWDLFVLPVQMAANLHNRGLGVRLLNVMTKGLLSIASSDPALVTIEALRGKTVSAPARDDAPSVLLRALLALYGLNPEQDVIMQYSGSPMESGQLLATGRVDAALLAEPMMTVLALKTAKTERPILRVIDFQKAWSEKIGRPTSLPQAGLGVSQRFWEKRETIARDVQKALAQAVESAQKNPALAAADAASFFDLPTDFLSASIPHMNLTAERALEARGDLEAIYEIILRHDPEIIGGRLPDSNFYL